MFDLLSVFFPGRCPYCRELTGTNRHECDRCRSTLPVRTVSKKLPSGEVCVAPFYYEKQVRMAIIDMKFHRCPFNSKSLADNMAVTVRSAFESESIAVVTGVPMLKEQKRKRGYDQAELLARELSGLIRIQYKPLLKKAVANLTQHELSGEKRKKNVSGVYEAVNTGCFQGKTVLLVDDICTTGYTLSECCKVLREAGAGKVICAAAAITDIKLESQTGM